MNNINLSYGSKCKDNTKPLTTINLIALFDKIISPNEKELVDMTQNLRSVLKYSQDRYRQMKVNLPYISCSIFNPPMRGIQNFDHACGLVIDIDLKEIVTDKILEPLKLDPRVALGYISPSKMGIKLIFLFDAPITDAGLYKEFYKKFSFHFGNQYHLSNSLDQKNCDVSRISFICHDITAWTNPDPELLKVYDFIDPIPDILSFDDEPVQKKIPDTAYRKILELLDTKPKSPKREVPLMPEISELIDPLTKELQIYDIEILKTESIQYGAKIKIKKDRDNGEINVYHGKQGYKVVTSPRKGTDLNLNEIARYIIQSLLDKY